jgi:hypothetical protein
MDTGRETCITVAPSLLYQYPVKWPYVDQFYVEKIDNMLSGQHAYFIVIPLLRYYGI